MQDTFGIVTFFSLLPFLVELLQLGFPVIDCSHRLYTMPLAFCTFFYYFRLFLIEKRKDAAHSIAEKSHAVSDQIEEVSHRPKYIIFMELQFLEKGFHQRCRINYQGKSQALANEPEHRVNRLHLFISLLRDSCIIKCPEI